MRRQSGQNCGLFRFRVLSLAVAALFADVLGTAAAQQETIVTNIIRNFSSSSSREETTFEGLQLNNSRVSFGSGAQGTVNQNLIVAGGASTLDVSGVGTSVNVKGIASIRTVQLNSGIQIGSSLTIRDMAVLSANSVRLTHEAINVAIEPIRINFGTLLVQTGGTLNARVLLSRGKQFRVESGGTVNMTQDGSLADFTLSPGVGNGNRRGLVRITGKSSAGKASTVHAASMTFEGSQGGYDVEIREGGQLILVAPQAARGDINFNQTGGDQVGRLDLRIVGAQSRVSAADLNLGANTSVQVSGGTLDLSGSVNISAPATVITIGGGGRESAPGVINTGSTGAINFLGSSGTGANVSRLVFAHSDISGQYRFESAVTGQGLIEHQSGHTVMETRRRVAVGPLEVAVLASDLTVTGGILEMLNYRLDGALALQGGELRLRGGVLGSQLQSVQTGTLTLSERVDANGLQAQGTAQVNVQGKTSTFQVNGSVALSASSSLTASDQARVEAQDVQIADGATLNVASGARVEAPMTLTGGTVQVKEGGIVRILDSARRNALGTLSLAAAADPNPARNKKIEVTGDQSLFEAASIAHAGGALDLLVSNGARMLLGASGTPAPANSPALGLGASGAANKVNLTVSGQGSLLSAADATLGAGVVASVKTGAHVAVGGNNTASGIFRIDNTGAEKTSLSVSDPGSRFTATQFIVQGSTADVQVSGGAELLIGKGTSGGQPAMQVNQEGASQAVSINVDGQGSRLQSHGMGLGAMASLVLSSGATLDLSESLALTADDAAVYIGGKDSSMAPGLLKTSGDAVGIVMREQAPGAAAGLGPRLVFNHTDTTGNYVMTAPVSGAGRIEHRAGVTTLDGRGSAAAREVLSQVSVAGGRLITRNTSLLGPVSIGPAALLDFGGGRLGATEVEDGGLALPTEQATQVLGDLTMTPASTLLVSVHGPAAKADAPRVDVGGVAIIEQAALTVQLPIDVPYGLALTVLRADGGLQGEFGTVATATPLEFLTPKLSYVDQSVLFELEHSRRFNEVAKGANATATASALDALPEDSPIRQHIEVLPGGYGDRAFQTLSGDSVTAVDAVLQVGAVSNVTTLPLNHLRANLARSSLAILRQRSDAPPGDGSAVWAEVGHTRQRESGSSVVPGLKARTDGVYLGADRPVGGDWRVGGALGFSHTKVDTLRRAASSRIDNYSADIYAGRHWSVGPGQINVMGGSAYTWHSIRTERSLSGAMLEGRVTAKYPANTTQLFAELAYGLPVGGLFDVEPYVGFNWNDLRVRGFGEEGGAMGALSGEAQRYRSYATTLGLRTGFGGEVANSPVRLSVDVAWRRKGGDLTPRGQMRFAGSGAQSFEVQGVALDKNALLLGATVQMAAMKRGSIGLSYNGEIGKKRQREHSFSLEGRWAF